jgi:hypothetical protein
MGVDEFEFDWRPGTRLSAIQARHAGSNEAFVNMVTVSDTISTCKASTHRSEIYTGEWRALDFRFIKLAATVIFCVVIAIFIGEFTSFACLQWN